MLRLGSIALHSRLVMGTAHYASPEIMQAAVIASGTEMLTVSVRRHGPGDNAGHAFWDFVLQTGLPLLPNTGGCHSVQEAVATALLAREIFGTRRIKLEVIGDAYTRQPDPSGLIEAARELTGQGFEVLPSTTDDLVVASRLVEAGCRVVMPWTAPLGSGEGLRNREALILLRERLPTITLVVDEGLRGPSEAAHVMELGFDGVLLSSAVALAGDPVAMAGAFRQAVEAGRSAHEAGLMRPRPQASPVAPTLGTPFWHQEAATGRAFSR